MNPCRSRSCCCRRRARRPANGRRRLADACPELEIIVPETMRGRRAGDRAGRGRLWHDPAALLPRAEHLRWLQAPQAAPPAGYYYPELIAHPVADHQFPRDLQRPYRRAHHELCARLRARPACLPAAAAAPRMEAGAARERRRRAPAGGDGADRRGRRHRRRGGAAGGGVRHARSSASTSAAPDKPRGGRRTAPRRRARRAAAAGRFRDPDRAAHARDRGLHEPRAVPADEEERVLHQYRPRHDDQARRSGRRARGQARSPAPRSTSTRSSRCRPTIRCGRCRACC